ncbi:MAG: sulfate transporter permease [Phycisphaerales bacterium]|nr:sulfate transporter permease [Phycisphaerales bacterium]
MRATAPSPLVRLALIALAAVLVVAFLVLPLAVVFYEGLRAGWAAYWQQVADPRTWHSVKLSLVTAAVSVPLNTLFGVAAAWCVTKFAFRGKSVLVTLIDLPFAVSPVIAGLSLWLLFGRTGWFAWVNGTYELAVPLIGTFEVTPRVTFALPGMVLATVFITFPFVARELIPLMQAQGTDEEQAARSLGAGGWTVFRRVTLPNVKWGLLYGVILCNARAVGEFGAVYVVSDRSAAQQTLPLRIERLYYETVVTVVPVFAAASLLAVVGLLTIAVKAVVEWRYKEEMAATERPM